MSAAEQMADELYGLHCDIGRLERDNAKLRRLLEGIARGTYRELCTHRDKPECKECSMRDGDMTCLIADASQFLGIEVVE